MGAGGTYGPRQKRWRSFVAAAALILWLNLSTFGNGLDDLDGGGAELHNEGGGSGRLLTYRKRARRTERWRTRTSECTEVYALAQFHDEPRLLASPVNTLLRSAVTVTYHVGSNGELMFQVAR